MDDCVVALLSNFATLVRSSLSFFAPIPCSLNEASCPINPTAAKNSASHVMSRPSFEVLVSENSELIRHFLAQFTSCLKRVRGEF